MAVSVSHRNEWDFYSVFAICIRSRRWPGSSAHAVARYIALHFGDGSLITHTKIFRYFSIRCDLMRPNGKCNRQPDAKNYGQEARQAHDMRAIAAASPPAGTFPSKQKRFGREPNATPLFSWSLLNARDSQDSARASNP